MAYPKYFKLKLLVFIICLFISKVSLCQCTSTILNPLTNIEASSFNDTVIISTTSNAGEYFIIEKLSLGDTYIFSSSNVTDYITIRDKDGLTLLAHGLSPLSYTISGADIVSVHINLEAPSCGAELVNRTTYAVCNTCQSTPPEVEVASVLKVSGVITVSDVVVSPETGMIRWNDSTNDFEGYDGEKWRSLTRKKSWGSVPIFDGNENQKMIAPDGDSIAHFGISVSRSGDYAIIGANKDDVGANIDQGSAYIYKRNGNTWVQQAQVTAADGSAYDNFGNAVSISGDYAIVGAVFDDVGANIDQGSAYIFMRTGSTWTQQAQLTAADGTADDFLGNIVSISGDYAIVAAQFDDVGANTDQGSAYVYERTGSTWTQQAQLTAAGGSADDYFGVFVSISGDYAVVGANGDDVGANTNQGSAYVYKRTGTIWTQQAQLNAADGSASDMFGISVFISGDCVIVGAYLDDVEANTNQGSAYIYIRTDTIWTQQAQLTAADGSASDWFGNSVSISGDYAIVGAIFVTVGTNIEQGSAYVYERNGSTWTQQTKLTAANGSAGDVFGSSVFVSGDFAMVGAWSADVGTNTNQGLAYFFNK